MSDHRNDSDSVVSVAFNATVARGVKSGDLRPTGKIMDSILNVAFVALKIKKRKWSILTLFTIG